LAFQSISKRFVAALLKQEQSMVAATSSDSTVGSRSAWRHILLALAFAAPMLTHAQVIDQSAPVATTGIAAFSATGLAQSFRPAGDDVSGAGVYVVGGDGFPVQVFISLWDGLPNASGQQLAGGAQLAGVDGWRDVFWAPVGVAAGTTLYLVFTGGDGRALAGDEGNGYARGNAFANAGFEAFPQLDYAFRTYTSNAPVPEPANWLLLALGLIGLTLGARQKAGVGGV